MKPLGASCGTNYFQGNDLDLVPQVPAKILGDRRMVISPKLSYPALPNDARSLVDQSLSRLGQGHCDGRLRRAIRRLDSVGGQTADRIPTPLVPGRSIPKAPVPWSGIPLLTT